MTPTRRYLLFCYYWTSEFITALGQIIMAMAVSYWYFSRNKAKEIGNSTVSKSIRTTLRYHAGGRGSCSMPCPVRLILSHPIYRA